MKIHLRHSDCCPLCHLSEMRKSKMCSRKVELKTKPKIWMLLEILKSSRQHKMIWYYIFIACEKFYSESGTHVLFLIFYSYIRDATKITEASRLLLRYLVNEMSAGVRVFLRLPFAFKSDYLRAMSLCKQHKFKFFKYSIYSVSRNYSNTRIIDFIHNAISLCLLF